MLPVYTIVCSELPEREAAVRRHLQEKGVPSVFWRAAHGNSWGLDTRKEYEPGHRISPAHVSLNLSTWFLWQHVLLSPPDCRGSFGDERTDLVTGNVDEQYDGDTFVVFEDDVVLPDGFPRKLLDLQGRLRRDFADWDLVFLGLAEVEPHVWNKVTERVGPPDSPLCRMNDPFGTHAIMLRRRALPVLLENMRLAERNLDQQLWERVLKPGLLKWCAVLPSLVTQRTFDYAGTGKPEWHNSTEDPLAPPPVKALVAEGVEIKRAVMKDERYGRPSVELYNMTMAAVDPYPCIYRGEGTDEVAHTPEGKTAPLFDCTYFDTPCHIKTATVIEEGDVRACARCAERTKMASDSPRERLPLPDGHFNPSMHFWNGKLVLASRDSWGHSKVALWELANSRPDWTGKWSASPIGSYASKHHEAPRLEDPRLFVAPDDDGRLHLCAAFNLPDGYPPKKVKVGYARFAPDLSGIEETYVFSSPHANTYEKNWVPFADDNGLHWVYSTKPDHLVLGQTQNFRTDNRLPWTGGVIRGGAAPVEVDPQDEFGKLLGFNRTVYVHFFHGALKRIQGTVYTVGAAVFDGYPPYQVLRQTRRPLLWPDLPGVGEDVVKRYVTWIGGAVSHAGKWWLALGIDDTNCRISSLSFETVAGALSDVPETRTAPGLRDTPLAVGTTGV